MLCYNKSDLFPTVASPPTLSLVSQRPTHQGPSMFCVLAQPICSVLMSPSGWQWTCVLSVIRTATVASSHLSCAMAPNRHASMLLIRCRLCNHKPPYEDGGWSTFLYKSIVLLCCCRLRGRSMLSVWWLLLWPAMLAHAKTNVSAMKHLDSYYH